MSDTVKYLLDETSIPTSWYNIQADLKIPLAPTLHPGTGQPVGPDDLAPLFPMALIEQEVSTERYIDIPVEVRDIYRQWRPAPDAVTEDALQGGLHGNSGGPRLQRIEELPPR